MTGADGWGGLGMDPVPGSEKMPPGTCSEQSPGTNFGGAAAGKRSAETRRRRGSLINMKKRPPDRRRKLGECPPVGIAVVAHCRECCGWSGDGLGSVADNVAACPATECWLWPWRSGKLDEAAIAAERK